MVSLLPLVYSAIAFVAVTSTAQADLICAAGYGASYPAAKLKYPQYADPLKAVEGKGVVTWFTDNHLRNEDVAQVKELVANCQFDERIPVVVYGIPNKDCEAGFSNIGTNKNFSDYKQFLYDLTSLIGERKATYILEPDAIGLLVNGGCAVQLGYLDFLKYAIAELSKNDNADIFLDIGFWVVEGRGQEVARIINQLFEGKENKLKGIVLNTSNYQRTEKMVELCRKFNQIAGREIKCVIDTSRNYLGSPTSGEWCNAKDTGIGIPPTANTGYDLISYFLWIKVPGESDGTCVGQTSPDYMIGPKAGDFFASHFVQLWNNGYFVKELKYQTLPFTN
jgi:cellulase/cellobiase CelA1